MNPQKTTPDIQYVDPLKTPLTANKPGIWNDPVFRRVIIIGGTLIVATVIILLVVNTFIRRSNTALDYYYSRLNNLITVQDEFGGNGNGLSTPLKKLNTEVRIALTNAKSNFDKLASSVSFDPKAIDSKVATEEEVVLEEITQNLNQAKQRGGFEKAFGSVFASQINLMLESLEIANTSIATTDFNEYYIGTKSDLQSLQLNFANFAGV